MPARRVRSSLPDLDLPPASSPDPLSDIDPRWDRRRFIRSSAIAVAGLLAASALPMDPVLAAHRHHHIHFGAGCEPQGTQDQRAAVLELERKIDRKLGIVRRYTFWECDIPDGTHRWAAAHGRTPYISWHAYTQGGQTIPWRSIAQGDHDAHIRNRAHTIKAWGKHVYLSFHHEPENDPANGGPAEFRAASNRVHTLFKDVGADNVTWVVALMASTYGGGSWRRERVAPETLPPRGRRRLQPVPVRSRLPVAELPRDIRPSPAVGSSCEQGSLHRRIWVRREGRVWRKRRRGCQGCVVPRGCGHDGLVA